MKVYIVQFRKQSHTYRHTQDVALSLETAKRSVAETIARVLDPKPQPPPEWHEDLAKRAWWTEAMWGTYIIDEWETVPEATDGT